MGVVIGERLTQSTSPSCLPARRTNSLARRTVAELDFDAVGTRFQILSAFDRLSIRGNVQVLFELFHVLFKQLVDGLFRLLFSGNCRAWPQGLGSTDACECNLARISGLRSPAASGIRVPSFRRRPTRLAAASRLMPFGSNASGQARSRSSAARIGCPLTRVRPRRLQSGTRVRASRFDDEVVETGSRHGGAHPFRGKRHP